MDQRKLTVLVEGDVRRAAVSANGTGIQCFGNSSGQMEGSSSIKLADEHVRVGVTLYGPVGASFKVTLELEGAGKFDVESEMVTDVALLPLHLTLADFN